MTSEIIDAMVDEFGLTDRASLSKKAKQWIEKYPGVNIVNEIKKASRWEIGRPAKRRAKNKLLFINNWLKKAGAFSGDAGNLYKFYDERFKRDHAGISYEPQQRDVGILQALIDKRGLIPSFILVEAFFMKDATENYRFFPAASRTISAMKSCLNEMFSFPPVQNALENHAHIESKLIERGFLNGQPARASNGRSSVLSGEQGNHRNGIPEKSGDSRESGKRDAVYMGGA